MIVSFSIYRIPSKYRRNDQIAVPIQDYKTCPTSICKSSNLATSLYCKSYGKKPVIFFLVLVNDYIYQNNYQNKI